MKISKRQLRRIIKEEKARILAEQGPQFDSEVAAEAMAGLKADGSFEAIQAVATQAVKTLEDGTEHLDIPLMDAGLNELAMDIRKAVELLDKIRNSAYNLR